MVQLSDVKRGDLLHDERSGKMYLVRKNPERGLYVWSGLMDNYLKDYCDQDGRLGWRYGDYVHVDIDARFAELSPDEGMIKRSADYHSEEIEGLSLADDELGIRLIDDQEQVIARFDFEEYGAANAMSAAEAALEEQRNHWIKSGCVVLSNFDLTGKSDADYAPLIVASR